MSILHSYRWRRRIAFTAVGVGVAVPLIWLGVRYSDPGNPENANGPTVANYVRTKDVPFTPAQRRQVHQVLKRFIGEVGDLEGLRRRGSRRGGGTRCRGACCGRGRGGTGGRRGRRAATRREDESDSDQAQQAFPPGPADSCAHVSSSTDQAPRRCAGVCRAGKHVSSHIARLWSGVDHPFAPTVHAGSSPDRHWNVTGPATLPFRPDLRRRSGCVAWMNTSALLRGSADPPIDRTGVLR